MSNSIDPQTGQAVYVVDGTETAVAIIWAQALGGNVRWRGCPDGHLHAPNGGVIGSYYDKPGGYSVWTTPYAGFAYRNELELIPCPEGGKTDTRS